MRLSKPLPVREVPKYFDLNFSENSINACGGIQVEQLLFLGDIVAVPSHFGNIYVGEYFICYIRVSNDGDSTVKDVSVKVDIQAVTKSLMLTTKSTERLAPKEGLDIIVIHEVKVLGKHNLLVLVNYTEEMGEAVTFRRSFKFVTLNPLTLKTKIQQVKENFYLEAQIQNLMDVPMHLEKIALRVDSKIKVTDLNTLPTTTGSELRPLNFDSCFGWKNIFDKKAYINATDVRRYLFKISPPKQSQLKTIIWNFELGWRTAMGQRGRLQTNLSQYEIETSEELLFFVEAPSSEIILYEPFILECNISNLSQQTLNLKLYSANNDAIFLCSKEGSKVKPLASGCSTCFDLTFVAVKKGLQPLCTVRLEDSSAEKSYSFETARHVFVRQKNNRS
ncbi:trafficking protein particle complex subunit 13-like [Zophobas morio]|uniref:trafficking protein particle complex subunit 13-like n=1 Tax=Zophobas morio TaxID=2755281 RepID=UPI00308372CC